MVDMLRQATEFTKVSWVIIMAGVRRDLIVSAMKSHTALYRVTREVAAVRGEI